MVGDFPCFGHAYPIFGSGPILHSIPECTKPRESLRLRRSLPEKSHQMRDFSVIENRYRTTMFSVIKMGKYDPRCGKCESARYRAQNQETLKIPSSESKTTLCDSQHGTH